MKKSQILAALALAFALGVVAPVAGTASAFTQGDQTVTPNVKGSATEAEVDAAISTVTSEATYKAMEALANVMTEYNKANGAYADYAMSPTVATLPQVYTALVAALRSANVNVSALPTDNTANESLVTLVNSAIAYANDTNLADYSYLSSIFTAVKNKDNAAFRTAVASYSDHFGAGINADGTVTVATYYPTGLAGASATDLIGANFDVNKSTGAYMNYLAIFNAVQAAQEANAKYTAGRNAFVNALNGTGVLSNAGIIAYSGDVRNPNTKISTFAAYTAAPASNLNNYAGWANVRTKVKDAQDRKVNADNEWNYNLIRAIASELKTVNVNIRETADEIAAQLVNGKAPIVNNPEDTDKPGDNNGDDQKDPSAPGTGVISSADGNAATTVSIVAGLATALTALGAGVVAYRSARRSSEK